MDDARVPVFLETYSHFVRRFDLAATPSDLIRILVESTGWKPIATVVFDPKTGDLFPFAILLQRTWSHLRSLVNSAQPELSFLLLANVELYRKQSQELRERLERFAPVRQQNQQTSSELRQQLLQQPERPSFDAFIDPRTMEPWTDAWELQAWLMQK